MVPFPCLVCYMPGKCLLHVGEKLLLSRKKGQGIVQEAAAFSCTAKQAETIHKEIQKDN